MLSANKSEYFEIYFSMSAIDSFWVIALQSMHYTEDTVWHKKTPHQVPFECDISKAIHINRHMGNFLSITGQLVRSNSRGSVGEPAASWPAMLQIFGNLNSKYLPPDTTVYHKNSVA